MAFENLKSTGIAYVLTKLKDYFLQIKDAVRSVNNNEPDGNGNITLNTVPYAQNLETSVSHRDYASFILRTAGGSNSLENGDAWLMDIKGANIHEGFVPESIDMTINHASGSDIDATINRDTFVAYVTQSGTITLVYSSAWSADPSLYGITVTGTPVSGDNITIVYVKEQRGTITVAEPHSLISTGWNLYNHTLGYARVVKYSFGYHVDGTYTALQYSATESGTKSAITITDGAFDIPADGYVWVTGGNSTDTAIWATWEDWTEEYAGEFSAYSQTEVDLSEIIGQESGFPYGLLKAGSVLDEINLNLGTAIQRVERLEYNAENLATAKNSGREYEYDENYIYLALVTPVTTSIIIDGGFTANDHGIEYFSYTDVPVQTEILYGSNLKNKIERDVLTISQQTLTSAQQAQVRTNIDAASASGFAYNDVAVTASTGYLFSNGATVANDYWIVFTGYFQTSGGSQITKITSDTTIGSIPTGHAPSAFRQVVVPIGSGSAVTGSAVIRVNTNGTIVCRYMTGNGFIFMNGISIMK